jgi:hypothetical protein
MRDARTSDTHWSDDSTGVEEFDLKAACDRDSKSVEEMFERFLNPNWDEYLSANCTRTEIGSHCYRYPIDNMHPESITAELKQTTIELAIATLEAAEAALFARLSAAILETTQITD